MFGWRRSTRSCLHVRDGGRSAAGGQHRDGTIPRPLTDQVRQPSLEAPTCWFDPCAALSDPGIVTGPAAKRTYRSIAIFNQTGRTVVDLQANQQRHAAGAGPRGAHTVSASRLQRQFNTVRKRASDAPATAVPLQGAIATMPNLMNGVAPAQSREHAADAAAVVPSVDRGWSA